MDQGDAGAMGDGVFGFWGASSIRLQREFIFLFALFDDRVETSSPGRVNGQMVTASGVADWSDSTNS